MTYQLADLARDLVLSALALRVFGPRAAALSRRAVAAVVRVGVSEMQRRLPGDER
ncbi:hypothetical protein OK074_3597 [Actinobacteria bacterium OK074]|nr:hypothetical protein OK074_3597 [Actinobacteria bacterium OK074]